MSANGHRTGFAGFFCFLQVAERKQDSIDSQESQPVCTKHVHEGLGRLATPVPQLSDLPVQDSSQRTPSMRRNNQRTASRRTGEHDSMLERSLDGADDANGRSINRSLEE